MINNRGVTITPPPMMVNNGLMKKTIVNHDANLSAVSPGLSQLTQGSRDLCTKATWLMVNDGSYLNH